MHCLIVNVIIILCKKCDNTFYEDEEESGNYIKKYLKKLL